MGAAKEKTGTYFLMCERNWIYHTLITVAGFYGAFTYLLRGNVFCNAQTGNVVLMGMALGSGEWGHALYYVIPISAYLMGAASFRSWCPTPSNTTCPALGHPVVGH